MLKRHTSHLNFLDYQMTAVIFTVKSASSAWKNYILNLKYLLRLYQVNVFETQGFDCVHSLEAILVVPVCILYVSVCISLILSYVVYYTAVDGYSS